MKKCSLAWCPWPAKYNFGMMDYYECWFHGGLIPWLEPLWDFFVNPIMADYNWLYLKLLGDRQVPFPCIWGWRMYKVIKFLKKILSY